MGKNKLEFWQRSVGTPHAIESISKWMVLFIRNPESGKSEKSIM